MILLAATNEFPLPTDWPGAFAIVGVAVAIAWVLTTLFRS